MDGSRPSIAVGPARVYFLGGSPDPAGAPEAMLIIHGEGSVLVVFRGAGAAGSWTAGMSHLLRPAVLRMDRSSRMQELGGRLCALPSISLVVASAPRLCPCGDAEGAGADRSCAALSDDGAVILELDGSGVERVLWR
jgi:hypothetical protein